MTVATALMGAGTAQTLVLTDAMLVSGLVLLLTFIGIFTEHVHGMERVKFAAAGAAIMIITGQLYGFYSPEQAVEAVNWNVIFLLAAMMTIIAIMLPTGGFDMISRRISELAAGRQRLLLLLIGVSVMLASCVLDNITTVVIFGPLIIQIAHAQRINPMPYLLAGALLSNIGGMATLIGDPPSVMIGDAAGFNFRRFSAHLAPLALLAAGLALVLLDYAFRRRLSAESGVSGEGTAEIRNRKIWNLSLFILAGMLVLFTIHDRLGWQPWFIAALGMSCLVLASRRVVMDYTFENVEIALLIFVISLFMTVGGVEQSGLFSYIGQLVAPLLERDLVSTSLLLLCLVAALSAFIDNIALSAALVPVVAGLAEQGVNVTPLWWVIAAGIVIGGNCTHIGSLAGMYVVTISERYARQENNPALVIRPGQWIRSAVPISVVSLLCIAVIVYFFFGRFDGAV